MKKNSSLNKIGQYLPSQYYVLLRQQLSAIFVVAWIVLLLVLALLVPYVLKANAPTHSLATEFANYTIDFTKDFTNISGKNSLANTVTDGWATAYLFNKFSISQSNLTVTRSQSAFTKKRLARMCYAQLASTPSFTYSSSDALAIQQASNDAIEGDLIKVAGYCGGVNTQTVGINKIFSQTVYISTALTIEGGYTTTNWVSSDPIANPTVLDAQHKGRVVFINENVIAKTVHIKNINIIDGHIVTDGDCPIGGCGGGIFSFSPLYLTNTTVFSNFSRFQGGGIYGSQAITITDSVLINNRSGTHEGGGVFVFGPLHLRNTQILTNKGRGVYALQSVNVVDSLIENNTSKVSGAGVYAKGNLIISNTQFISNASGLKLSGSGIVGGGAYANDNATITNSFFENNASRNGGGGIYVKFGDLTIDGSIFRGNNTLFGQGGGAYAPGFGEGKQTLITNSRFEYNSSYLNGGGLYANNLTIIDKTIFDGNMANRLPSLSSGGGAYINAIAQITNSRFENNYSSDLGGGLWVVELASLKKSIFSNNIAQYSGGGIYIQGYASTNHDIYNTLFYGNGVVDSTNGHGAQLHVFPYGTFNATSEVNIYYSTFSEHSTFSSPPPVPVLKPEAIYVGDGSVINFGNSIIEGHTIGLQNTNASNVSNWYNVFFNNVTPFTGPNITGGEFLYGNPLFRNPNNGDYRLGINSSARNTAATLSPPILEDLDSNVRPQEGTTDRGAYEFKNINLLINKSSNPADAVAPGDWIDYTITFQNTSSAEAIAKGVIITDIVPASLINVSYVNNQPAVVITPIGTSNYTWQVENLSPGENGSITVSGQVPPNTNQDYFERITNTVTITSDDLEISTANNTAVDIVDVVQPILGLSLSNDSPTLPGDLTTLTASIEQGTGEGANNLGVAYTLDFGDGSADEIGTFSRFAPLVTTHTYPGVGIYTATIQASNGLGSVNASSIVIVKIDSDLAINKTVSPTGPVMPGQPITYTLTFSNVGNSANRKEITITDIIPPELISTTVSNTGPSITPISGITYAWTLDNLLNPGVVGDINISGVIDPNLTAGTTLLNEATITNTYDITPTDNSDQVLLVVDVPSIGFSSATYEFVESNGNASIEVLLSPVNPYADVDVFYRVFDGTATDGIDYNAVSGTLTIPAANSTASFNVHINDDLIAEPDETILLELSNPVGASLNPIATTAVLTITDNDSPGIMVSPEVFTISEPNGFDTFNVRLNTQPAQSVSIAVNATPSDECSLLSNQITINSIYWNTGVNVQVNAVDDNIADGPQTCIIETLPATGDPEYVGIDANDVTVTVLDDENPQVIVPISDTFTVSEPSGSVDFVIALSSQPSANVNIPLTTSNNECTLGALSQITLNSINWQTGVTVTVTAVDDAIPDGTLSCVIQTGIVQSSDSNYNTLDPDDITIMVQDDDTPNVLATNYVIGISENGTTADYGLYLTTLPTTDVVLTLNPDGQIIVTPTIVTFTPLNWNTPQTITVSAVDDNFAEGLHNGFISHTSSSDDFDYDSANPNLNIADVRALITDNDNVNLQIAKSATPAEVVYGSTITYTLTFTNVGNGVATGVRITDTLPTEVTLQNAIANGVTITQTGTATEVVWLVDNLHQNQGGSITVIVQVNTIFDGPTPFTNIALIGSNIADSDISDNQAQATVVGVLGTDLAISIISNRPIGSPSINYDVTVRNLGPSDGSGAIVRDSIPGNVSSFSWTCQAFNGAACNTASGAGSVSQVIPVFPANSYVVFSIVANLINPDLGVINTASVTPPSSVTDPYLPNNQFIHNSNSRAIYMPIIFKNYVPTQAPDLIITSLTATTDTVTLVIKNVGNAAVVDTFWVDAYIDPSPIPTGPNGEWWRVADQGLVWGITIPLGIGETLQLTTGDQYYQPADSVFTTPLTINTPVYAQVDSVNQGISYGHVLEIHEIVGWAYNNINSTLSTLKSVDGVEPIFINENQPLFYKEFPPRQIP